MMLQSKILFIVNPVSGNKNNKPDENKIRKFCKNNFLSIEYVHSKYKGNGTELAKAAVAENFNVVVAVGGDGTVNEIALALNGTGISLGIIPSGSGNGLARHHKIPFDVEKAIQVIINNNVTDHDSIKINNYVSFNVSGIGFDAHVAHLFGKDGKRGFSTYARLVMQEFRKFKEFAFVIDDGRQQTSMDAFLLAIANATQFGNNTHIAPLADTNDGLTDISIVSKIKIHQLPLFGYRAFTGLVQNPSLAKMIQIEKAAIICEREMPLHIDGEAAGYASRFEITTIKSSLKLIVP